MKTIIVILAAAVLSGCGVYLPKCTHNKCTYISGGVGALTMDTGAEITPSLNASVTRDAAADEEEAGDVDQ